MYGSWVLVIIILLSSIPVIIVYTWFRLAKYQYKPVHFLLTLLAGATAFFPALILQDLLNFSFSARGKMELFYHVFVRIAFTEELSRLLMLLIFFWLGGIIAKNDSDQPLSWTVVKKGAAVGLVAGLGFALVENTVYAASNTAVLLLRAITATLLHAACGSRVGTAAVMLRSNPFQAVVRLLIAAVIHGIYNFMIILPGFPSIIAILIALSALVTSILLIQNTPGKPLTQ